MPTISKTALLSGAAKDDALGADGDFTFTINDLLANDPGGAVKLNIDTQFFFGDTAADQANQAQYLINHGITDNHNGTYTISSTATDFSYFEQIGNKGTWSEAHVDVTAPAPVSHVGASLFAEDFDGRGAYELVSQSVRLDVTDSGDTDTNGWTGTTSVQFTMALESPALPETTG